MSVFSHVDTNDDPGAAVEYLDQIARSQTGMKHYAAASHARRSPRGFVLDVGCGAGHDLALLATVGLPAVGIDTSLTMLHTAAQRTRSPLAQADGTALPFRSASLAGCRIERVLIHVADPIALLAEAARCLEPGALITVFEPDWSHFLVRDHDELVSAAWLAPVRHPDAGSCLWDWVSTSGFTVLDRIEELSVWRSLDTLNRVINLDQAISRAVDVGRVTAHAAAAWQTRQVENDASSEFISLMPKIQIVAERAAE